MEEKTLIIKTIQKTEDISEKNEIEVLGKWYNKNEKKYLIYKEDNFTSVRIKLEKDKLNLQKTGEINLSLDFDLNEKKVGKLETPYGILTIYIETLEIKITEESLCLEYKLFDERNKLYLDNTIEIITK